MKCLEGKLSGERSFFGDIAHRRDVILRHSSLVTGRTNRHFGDDDSPVLVQKAFAISNLVGFAGIDGLVDIFADANVVGVCEVLRVVSDQFLFGTTTHPAKSVVHGQEHSTAIAEDHGCHIPLESEAEALLALSQRFRLAFEGNMAPMVFSDRSGMFLAVNDAFCRMSGRAKEELIGNDSKHFTYPDDVGISEDVYQAINSGETDQVRYGKRFLHKNGRIVIAEVSISPARDETGVAKYYVSSVRDITEERALAAQLSFQALHDPLTGLANRALFDDRLGQAHAR